MRLWRSMVTGGALLAAGLVGCSSNLGQHLPESMGGLPAGAPAPAPTAYGYPAVHDMPPDRPVKPLSDAEQTRIENELRSAKERQEQEAAAVAGAADIAANPELPPPAVPDKTTSKQRTFPKNAGGNAGNTGEGGKP